jgi:N6-adenosine-specific RNA methylase IME4
MSVTTNEHGQQNMWATEPTMYMTKESLDRYGIETHAERAEKLNGRTAMMGFVAALISYAATGKLFFGIV